MTRTDIQELLMMIEAFYPNAKFPNPTYTVDAWASVLAEYDREIIFQAVRVYVLTDTSGFAPAVGQILACTPSDIPTWEETAVILHRAVRNGLYGAEEEFNRLPGVIQKIVGSPNVLREWAMMDTAQFATVQMSQARKTYHAVAESEKKKRARSGETGQLKQLVSDTVAQLPLDATKARIPAAKQKRISYKTNPGRNSP